MPKRRLFISYSSKNANAVDTLCERLRSLGLACFHFKHEDYGNVVGAKWPERLMDEMRRSDAMVLCLSRESLASSEVLNEIPMALILRKPVLPVKLTTESLEVPRPIRDLHRLPATNAAEIATAAQKINRRVTWTHVFVSWIYRQRGWFYLVSAAIALAMLCVYSVRVWARPFKLTVTDGDPPKLTLTDGGLPHAGQRKVVPNAIVGNGWRETTTDDDGNCIVYNWWPWRDAFTCTVFHPDYKPSGERTIEVYDAKPKIQLSRRKQHL